MSRLSYVIRILSCYSLQRSVLVFEMSGIQRHTAGGPKAVRQNETAEKRRDGDQSTFPRHGDGLGLDRRKCNGNRANVMLLFHI